MRQETATLYEAMLLWTIYGVVSVREAVKFVRTRECECRCDVDHSFIAREGSRCGACAWTAALFGESMTWRSG